MAHKRKFFFALLLLGVLWGGATHRTFFQELWASQWKEIAQDAALTASGTVEVRTVNVASKVGGYLRELRVREGDAVAVGELVAVVDRPDLVAQISRDGASWRRARAHLADLQSGSRPEEISEAAARVASARSRYEKSRQDFKRFESLHRDKVISDRQFDEYRAAFDGARADLAAAQDRYQLLLAGPRPLQVEAQRAEVEALAAALALSQSLLRDTRIEAPQSGVVLTKDVEEGEFVSPGSVLLTLGDLEDCWIRIYVPSPQMGRLRLGEGAEVRIDGFPQKIFAGKVTEIGQEAEFTPRMSLNQKERASQVFRVKVTVENGERVLKPGMPADVRLP